MQLVILSVLMLAGAAMAQDNVIGLLKLPEIFGEGGCDKFEPAEIQLFAAPGLGKAIGSIRVDNNWRFPADGGWEGLTVNVHKTGTKGVRALPAKEHSYKEPAAIVLEERERWFRVRLADGTRGFGLLIGRNFFPWRNCWSVS